MTLKSSGQVRIEGPNLSAARLSVSRALAGSSYPAILTIIDNGPSSSYPNNILTANFSGASSRLQGNYSFADSNSNGISYGGMSYIKYTNNSNPDEGLLFYTGGHPATQENTANDAMFIGGSNGSRNVYVGYPSPVAFQAALPNARLNVANGDIYISSLGSGVIMKSPDGNCHKVTVSSTGTLGTTGVTCP